MSHTSLFRFAAALQGLPLFALLLAGTAAAETSPYYIGASQTFSRSSNFLRLPDELPPDAGFSKSDTTSSTSLLAGLDQNIGRQHLFGDVAVRANRQSHNKVYNNTSYSLTGGLDWATVNDVSGNVTVAANRNLANFYTAEIGRLTKKNLETTKQLDTSWRVGMTSIWSAEATFGLRRVDYSAAEYIGREFRQTSGSLGLKYHPQSVATLGLALRNASGRYPSFRQFPDGSVQADEYSRQDLDFTARIVPSGISIIDARVSLSRTRYDVATQRDFSGLTGRIAWDWRPTGKLRFKTEFIREPGQDSFFLSTFVPDATVNYSRLTNSLRFNGNYEVTAKVKLNSSLSFSHSSLTRTVQIPNAPDNRDTGSEGRKYLTLGAVWTPNRALQLGCDFVRLQRSGHSPLSSDLHSSTYSCYGQLTLQ